MIKIIDYKAGNAPSVLHAVRSLGYTAEIITRPEELFGASHIILPGVGSADAAMQTLKDADFIKALNEAVLDKKIQFLGICVGMQILFDYSDEGAANCLGWLKGEVIRFNPARVRVPQMGWNEVSFCDGRHGYFYFVNSYYALPRDKSDVWGTADYGGIFTAAVRKNNIYGTQFHIEKSGETGLRLLDAFLAGGKNAD